MGQNQRRASPGRRKNSAKPTFEEGQEGVRGKGTGRKAEGRSASKAKPTGTARTGQLSLRPSAVGQVLNPPFAGLPHIMYPAATDPVSLTPAERFTWLTERERVILRLYLECRNAKAIARRIGKSAQTVKNQLAAIQHKMGVDSREDLLAFVYRHLVQNTDG